MLRVLPLMWPGFCIMEIADASEFLYWCLRLVRLSSRGFMSCGRLAIFLNRIVR
jgi:hypothetical protein